MSKVDDVESVLLDETPRAGFPPRRPSSTVNISSAPTRVSMVTRRRCGSPVQCRLPSLWGSSRRALVAPAWWPRLGCSRNRSAAAVEALGLDRPLGPRHDRATAPCGSPERQTPVPIEEEMRKSYLDYETCPSSSPRAARHPRRPEAGAPAGASSRCTSSASTENAPIKKSARRKFCRRVLGKVSPARGRRRSMRPWSGNGPGVLPALPAGGLGRATSARSTAIRPPRCATRDHVWPRSRTSCWPTSKDTGGFPRRT